MRPKSAPNRPSPTWLFLLGVVLAFFGTHAGRYWEFTVDDAGISFAYARNLATGHGLVMTPGAERVEAATNLLWCLLLTPAHWLGDSHELCAKLLGLLGACGALSAIAFFPSIAYARKPRYYDLVAPAVTACMPHFALWSVSGLETGLFAGLAASALCAVAWEEQDEKRFPWSGVLLVALFATRPDGVLYAAAIGATKLLRRITPRPARQDLVWGAVLLGGIGAIELFRLAYFAWLWPNSFYTKRRTFEFGKDLFDTSGAGWNYVGRWLTDYGFVSGPPVGSAAGANAAGTATGAALPGTGPVYAPAAILFAMPLVLLGRRAPVARIALFGFVCAAFFFPIYSHGDWMEEYRFLSFGAPFIVLAICEGVRAVMLIAQPLLPRSVRAPVAWALTPLAAYLVVSKTTTYWPARVHTVATSHNTLEFSFVQQRARYFVAAGHLLAIDGRPGLLDPDVGASSYDGRLRITDLFGLGDIAIAHTHPDDPPGSREAIFNERRPEFIHLHGAWFAAMELTRLEEMEHGYLRLPGHLPTGENEPDADWVRRESIAAPWYLTADVRPQAAPPAQGLVVDGFTLSHHGLEPGRRMMVELAYAPSTAGGAGGSIALVPTAGGRPFETTVTPTAGLIDAHEWRPGERPRTRAWFVPARGRYRVEWRPATHGVALVLGDVVVEPGAGDRESRSLRAQMDAAIARGRFGDALHLARTLGLRVVADDDRPALEALGHYAEALADRARRLADEGDAYRIAAVLAREARAWGGDDPRAASRIESVAELLADEARSAERRHDDRAAFVLSREAVLTDPRRSWSRRRAEETRAHAGPVYDGGRDQAAYAFAAAAQAGAADLDRAIVFLGSVERWLEAANLAERTGHTPSDPRARVVVARGLLSRGQATEALALVAGVPCASAHDPELTAGLRVLLGRPYRAGDTECVRPVASTGTPFDVAEGSFESGHWAGWTTTGRAFGRGPVHAKSEHQQFVNGWNGWYFASSYAGSGSDQGVGLLRSRPFVVRDVGLSFLVGGGSDTAHEGVRLMIDGHSVMASGGPDAEGLRRVFWDVRTFIGRTATIEAYDDNAGGGWGHVMVDDFRVEPVLPEGSGPASVVTPAPVEPTSPMPTPSVTPHVRPLAHVRGVKRAP